MKSPVPVTALYGAMSALLNVALAANVSRVRAARKIFLGDGGDELMTRAHRAHANNAEYVPLAIVLLLILELSGGPSLMLHVLGGVLVTGRVIHAAGMLSAGLAKGRVLGILLTWATIAALAVLDIYYRCGCSG